VAVQDVLLQQAEELFRGCVITGSADTAHGANHAVAARRMDESSAAKLRPAGGVDDAAGISPWCATLCRAVVASLDFIREYLQ
jgi:hypothetical protein